MGNTVSLIHTLEPNLILTFNWNDLSFRQSAYATRFINVGFGDI